MIGQFHKPASVQDALRLKTEFGETAVFLGGGTYVNSREFHSRPGHIIALDGLALDGIRIEEGKLLIGALCTFQKLIEHAEVPDAIRAAAMQITSRNIRNAATVGGHVARRMSCSDFIPMLVALDAHVVTIKPDAPEMTAVLDYIAAAGKGLITGISIPAIPDGRRAACRCFRVSANARSILSTAVSIRMDERVVCDPVVALAGMTPPVVRLTKLEKMLDRVALPPTDELHEMVVQSLGPISEPHSFKAYQAGALVAMALNDARGVKGGSR